MGKLALIILLKIFFVNNLFASQKSIDYLSDPKNRVSEVFNIPNYFKKDVRFWFDIYTKHSSEHIVLHDKENLSLIYDVIEFEELNNNTTLNKFTRFALKKRLSKARFKEFKKNFLYLQTNKARSKEQHKIIKALKKNKFTIPKISKKRIKLFKNLSKNLRSQTGQKDSIQSGINNFAPYSKTFMSWVKHFNLPHELIWISFLESSFNVKAKSKVGATGVWQFMRRIGKYFMKYNSREDGRLSPVMSTLGAFHLLHQNKKILRRWDLAIPAYNSGTKHLIKARRQLKEYAPSLEKVLSSYDHPHLGFASKHFYSGFLAISHALAYKEDFYDLSAAKKKYPVLNVYLSKCKINKKWFTSRLKKMSPRILEFNSHLKSNRINYPRGTILFSDIKLTKRRYLKLSLKQLRKKYPKNYNKYLKGHSCSTK